MVLVVVVSRLVMVSQMGSPSATHFVGVTPYSKISCLDIFVLRLFKCHLILFLKILMGIPFYFKLVKMMWYLH